jgi:hypothetical protein
VRDGARAEEYNMKSGLIQMIVDRMSIGGCTPTPLSWYSSSVNAMTAPPQFLISLTQGLSSLEASGDIEHLALEHAQ